MAELYLFQPFATFSFSNSVLCTVKLNACYSRHASANKFLSVNSRYSISGSIAKNSGWWRCFVLVAVLSFRYIFVQCPSLCHFSEPYLNDFVIRVLLLTRKLTIPDLYWLASANLKLQKVMYVCISMYVVCMYVCMFVCMYVCMCVCVCVCVCVCMYYVVLILKICTCSSHYLNTFYSVVFLILNTTAS